MQLVRGKRNVTVWRPSVRLSVSFFSNLHKARGAYSPSQWTAREAESAYFLPSLTRPILVY